MEQSGESYHTLFLPARRADPAAPRGDGPIPSGFQRSWAVLRPRQRGWGGKWGKRWRRVGWRVEGAPSRHPYVGRLSRQPIPCARTAAPTPLGPGGGRLGKGWRAPLAPPPRLSAVGRRHADWPPALPSRARRSASEQANTHRGRRSASGQETTHWGRRIGYPNDLLPTPMTCCPPQCGHASADMAPPSPSREGTTTAPPLRDARMAATPCAPSPGPWSPPRSGAGWKPVAVSMAPTPQRHGLEAGRSVSRCRGGRPSAAPGPR